MTHDELLEKIDSVFYEEEGGMQLDFAGFNNQHRAIRAVVELHKPVKDEWIEYTTCKACRVGDDDYYSPVYPCQTIQAIEMELK